MGRLKDMFSKNMKKEISIDDFKYNTPNQRWEIEDGIAKGMTREQLNLFAKPECDLLQMKEIKAGIMHGLTNGQIEMYAKPETLNSAKMREIRLGLEHGLSAEQINAYTVGFFHTQMEQVRLGFENGLSIEQMKVYADPKIAASEMEQIRKGFENGLSMEQVKVYAKIALENKNVPLRWMEMEKVRKLEIEYHVPADMAEAYLKCGERERYKIEYGLSHGFSIEQVRIYTNPELNWSVMGEIQIGIAEKLPIEDLQRLANPAFSEEQVIQLRIAAERNLTKEQKDFLAKDMFSIETGERIKMPVEKMSAFTYAFERGLSVDKISSYIDCNISRKTMGLICNDIIHGVSEEEIQSRIKNGVYEWEMENFDSETRNADNSMMDLQEENPEIDEDFEEDAEDIDFGDL